MKVLVISDSHGNYQKMYDLFHSDNFGAVIFLGDGLKDAQRLYDESGAVPVYKVCGNCDFMAINTLESQIIEISGKKIFITHGHKYGVKNGYHNLRLKAQKLAVDAAFFGHTHIQFYEKTDGLILANPGALAYGKYAVMQIQNGQINFKHGDIYES